MTEWEAEEDFWRAPLHEWDASIPVWKGAGGRREHMGAAAHGQHAVVHGWNNVCMWGGTRGIILHDTRTHTDGILILKRMARPSNVSYNRNRINITSKLKHKADTSNKAKNRQ